jgi:hypothetical protein
MVSENNRKKTVPATLWLILLSLSVASLIGISAPNDASAQGSLESLEAEQSGQGGSGGLPADTGVATLNNTTTGQPGGGPESSACAPTQTVGGGGGGGDGGQNGTTNGTTTTTMGGGGASDATTGNATTTLGGGSLSTSEVRDYIEQACIALEVGDTEGAMMQLNLALGELGGNIQGNTTSTAGGITGTTTTTSGGEGTVDEGATVGGTSASDDYDATADAEAG